VFLKAHVFAAVSSTAPKAPALVNDKKAHAGLAVLLICLQVRLGWFWQMVWTAQFGLLGLRSSLCSALSDGSFFFGGISGRLFVTGPPAGT
jgi:hypothetical protein